MAARLLQFVKELTADDLVLCLICGGGSSLLPLALPGLTLADKQALNRALLASGASISEMNCVRRHLAAACHPARVPNLVLSDVPGDDPIDIASGPTVADPTTCADAMNILRRYAIDVPPLALDLLESGEGETLKPGDSRLPTICVLMSGGETTVTVRGQGRGGRNAEFPLSLGIALNGEAGVHAIAGDTDGVDGQEEIAGALLTPDTLARAWAHGLRPA